MCPSARRSEASGPRFSVVLPVRDQIAPVVQLAVSSAGLLPGQVLRFVVTGADEVAVALN